MQIVLARLDDSQEVAKIGRVDIGQAHTFRDIKVPVAVVWLNDGTDADVAEAEKFAKTEGYTVFCYEGEADPLGRAKQDIVAEALAPLVTNKRGKERRIYRVINQQLGYYNIMDMGRIDRHGEHVVDQLYGGRSSIKVGQVEPYTGRLTPALAG